MPRIFIGKKGYLQFMLELKIAFSAGFDDPKTAGDRLWYLHGFFLNEKFKKRNMKFRRALSFHHSIILSCITTTSITPYELRIAPT